MHCAYRLQLLIASVNFVIMAGYYKDLGSGLLLLAVGFALGTIYSNWTFDYWLLWVSPTPEEWFPRAIEHYKLKAEQNVSLHHVLHGVIGLGFVGLLAKLYKPTEANTLFDGGSLVLYFIAVVFYISNMRPASFSLQTGDWGNIDEIQGVRMIAASQVLIVLILFGVIAMQAGQWWAIPKEIAQRKAFEAQQAIDAVKKENEAKEAAKQAAKEAKEGKAQAESKVKTSGSKRK